MRPVFYATTAIAACLLVCLGLLAIGTVSQAVPLDTSLNVLVTTPVCLPADAPGRHSIPDLPEPPLFRYLCRWIFRP